jgi:hypothetical protein
MRTSTLCVNLFGAVSSNVCRFADHANIGAAGTALFFLPIIALGGYTMLALIPVLSLIRIAKIVENTRTIPIRTLQRHALFLPTSREAEIQG